MTPNGLKLFELLKTDEEGHHPFLVSAHAPSDTVQTMEE